MKFCIKVLLCIFLFVPLSCKKKTKSFENKDDAIEVGSEVQSKEINGTHFKEVEDCDDFIDQYEEWMEGYIALLEKYKEDPIDLVNSSEYTQMTMQAIDWTSKWNTTLAASCATNPTYEKRMKVIQEQMEKKLKTIGLK